MISLAAEKSYSLPLFFFFPPLSPLFYKAEQASHWCVSSFIQTRRKIERDLEHRGITAQTVCHGQEPNLSLHWDSHVGFERQRPLNKC